MSDRTPSPKMYCDQCKKLTVCRSRNIPHHFSRWHELDSKEFVDIWNYKRERECEECYKRFETFEIQESDFIAFCRYQQSVQLAKAIKDETLKELDRANELIQELSRCLERVRKSTD